jgi:hypothetical protein
MAAPRVRGGNTLVAAGFAKKIFVCGGVVNYVFDN